MIGETHGHYHITERIGAGGMGEVYRATDTKLKRDVAIKVLPDEVAQDTDRLARFQREAELLASLNHPHIAAIHGLEEAAGKPLLILELVEGEDLSARIDRGPVPMGEALEVATQIADALGAAHEKGIVHRDLKPANVKITPEGQVKVLDFGLAKAWSGDHGAGSSSVDASQSPTLAHSGTAAGVILGTAAYMSPEQAMGKAVDKRADVWAFGVVLMEMLTGKRVFGGENASEILASVIKDEPAWERLPEGTPRPVTRLLRRCLRKKPRERLHDVSDARLELEDAGDETGESGGARGETRATGRERLAWVLAAVLPIAAVGLTAWSLRSPPARGALQLSIPLAPARIQFGQDRFAVSPDGSRVAFPGQEEDGPLLLYIRALDEPAARGLPGTENARAPFFSPDGEWVAFRVDNSTLKKVPVEGGPVVTLAEGRLRGAGGAWTEDGWIILNQPWGDRPGRLVRVRADGGALEPLEVEEADAQEFVNGVRTIPGSPALLLGLGRLSSQPEGVAIAVQSLETGTRSVLAPGGVLPRYLASGHVVYQHTGRLMIGRLDLDGMRFDGPPVPLRAIHEEEGVGYFDVSPEGVLVYASNLDQGRPVRPAWADRSGATTPLALEAFIRDAKLSPDVTRVILSDQDVWVLDLDRGTRTRISSAGGAPETATWSPDGQWVAWAARQGETRGLNRRRSDGSGPEERLWSDGRHFHVASWSAEGLVLTVEDPTTGWDVLLLDPDDPAETRPLLNTSFNETSARVSPDGRLVAFVSDETNQNEVYVQAFPESRGKVQVSIGGGVQPVWRPGTREIIYRGESQIMSVTLGPEAPPAVSVPRALMVDRFWGRDSTPDHTWYAVHPDGRLLVVEALEQDRRRDLRVVLDWMEEALNP